MPAGVVKPGTEAKWEEAKKSARKQLTPGTKRYWALVNYIYGKMTHRKEATVMAEYAYTDSKGKGHLPIGDAAHARNALARFNQTYFESAAKARAAWGHIMSAARKFGIKHEGGMPKPKIKAPAPGYKKAASAEVPQTSAFAAEIESDEAPEWIELLPAGRFTPVDGRGSFENEDPKAVVEASMRRMPEKGLVLDYDHSTDFAAPEGRPAPAAGWIKRFQVRDGAIFAQIEWTADAAEAIKEKKWRYVSPVFEHDKEGRVERILRAALTNNPALTQLRAVASAKSVMAKREDMSLHDKLAHFEAMFPPKDEEEMGAYHKRLLRKALKAHDDDDEDMDEAEAAGALKDWAEEEEHEHGMDGSMDDGDGGAGAVAGQDEDEEQMMRRQEDEMTRCAPAERDETMARHAREKEEMARRKEETSRRKEEGVRKEESSRREEAGYEESRARMAAKRLKQKVASAASTEEIARLVADAVKAGSRKEVLALQTELAEVKRAQAEAAATTLVEETIKKGRLLPSQREWGISYAAKDREGFQQFVAKQPVLLTPGADGTFTGKVPESMTELLTAKEQQVCTNLGITREQFVTAKKERLSYGVHFGEN